MGVYYRQTTFPAEIFVREPRSHAVHNPHTIDPEIESRIIELRREHPDWEKKRIAQWIWKGNCTRKCLGLPVFTQHILYKYIA